MHELWCVLWSENGRMQHKVQKRQETEARSRAVDPEQEARGRDEGSRSRASRASGRVERKGKRAREHGVCSPLVRRGGRARMSRRKQSKAEEEEDAECRKAEQEEDEERSKAKQSKAGQERRSRVKSE